MTGRIDLGFGDVVDSDTDISTREPTSAEWQRFELDVEKLSKDAAQGDRPATVKRDIKLTGIVSGTPRQVDVLIEGTLGRHPLRIAVECKHYRKPVGIKTVEAFIGMLIDLDVDRGAMYALNGYTDPARKRAEGSHHPHVELYEVDAERSEPIDYDDLLFPQDCPNPNCYMQIDRWRRFQAQSGEPLDVSVCDSCGTDVIRCFGCGDVVDVSSSAIEQCFGCYSTYELQRDRDSREIEYVLWRMRDEVFDFARPIGWDYDGEFTPDTEPYPIYRFRDAWTGEPQPPQRGLS